MNKNMVLLLLLLAHHKWNFSICFGSKLCNLPTSLEVFYNTFYLWTALKICSISNFCMTAFALQIFNFPVYSTYSTSNCIFGLVSSYSVQRHLIFPLQCVLCVIRVTTSPLQLYFYFLPWSIKWVTNNRQITCKPSEVHACHYTTLSIPLPCSK